MEAFGIGLGLLRFGIRLFFGIVLLAVAVLAGIVATGIPLRTARPVRGVWTRRAGGLVATWWSGGSMRRRRSSQSRIAWTAS